VQTNLLDRIRAMKSVTEISRANVPVIVESDRRGMFFSRGPQLAVTL